MDATVQMYFLRSNKLKIQTFLIIHTTFSTPTPACSTIPLNVDPIKIQTFLIFHTTFSTPAPARSTIPLYVDPT